MVEKEYSEKNIKEDWVALLRRIDSIEDMLRELVATTHEHAEKLQSIETVLGPVPGGSLDVPVGALVLAWSEGTIHPRGLSPGEDKRWVRSYAFGRFAGRTASGKPVIQGALDRDFDHVKEVTPRLLEMLRSDDINHSKIMEIILEERW